MPISMDGKNRTFHLQGKNLSMVLCVRQMQDGSDALLMPYFGARLESGDVPGALLTSERLASFDTDNATLPFALPTGGQGDFRPVQLTAVGQTGRRTTRATFIKAEILPGKPPLPGLPATYVESPDEAQTLRVSLHDGVTDMEAVLSYTLFRDHDAVAVSLCVENWGDQPFTLTDCASASISLYGAYDMLHLHGAWGKERQVERVAPMHGERAIRSCRGASGHQHNPFCALMARDATEHTGDVYGISLVYSGDFRIAVDEDAYGQTRAVCGINPDTLRWLVLPGERFQAPEAVLTYSADGLNGMSQIYHRLYRTRLCRGYWRDRERPVLINNWEATYFHFDHEKILRIARTAAELGVELFVLDDGWFGERDSDDCSLGDWTVNGRKLPGGLTALAKDVEALGMRFGLWFEPEMISPRSKLHEAHPDWVLRAPERYATQARNQWILDMSRRDVQDYVIEAVLSVLRSAPISYVKWDMNRNFAEYGSRALPPERQGEVPHRYMLGVYRVMEEITSAFPQVLFESCSGGGGRFDPGILYYMPQTWTSDDTDAVERLKIQYGTSVVYPASAMGAHVSAVPNHQVGRVTSMKMRGDVAMSGNFGYELDLSQQTPEDLEEIRRQIARVKQIRRVTQQGTFTRLQSPFKGNVCAWQFTLEDTVVFSAFVTLQDANPELRRVRLRDIPAGRWQDEDTGEVYDASVLCNAGVRLPFIAPGGVPVGDFQSVVMVLKKVE